MSKQIILHLFCDTLFHAHTKVEVRVCIARVRGNVELIHLDQVQPEVAAFASSRVERPDLHREKYVVAVDKELWVVYK